MSSFVKKLMATGAALSIGISSFAVADYTYNYSNNNCCPPPACAPCCLTDWCDNFSFNAAWLYWKVGGDDFQYANEKARAAVGTAGTFTSEQKFHDISFKNKSGFRVGLGFDLPSAGFGARVEWTHFHAGASSDTVVFGTTGAVTTTAGFPVLDGFITGGGIDSGDEVLFDANLKFKYDTVDIEFGKWMSCGCPSLMFRPHAGFRAADIEERFRDAVVASGDTVFVTDNGTFSGAAWQHKNRFKGFGVRAGLDTDFQLCDGWSLIGGASGSAIWGTSRLRNDLVLSTAAAAGFEVSEIRENYHQTRYIADLDFGLRYKTMACGCFPMTVELSWEFHYLFNQHRYWVDDSYGTSDPTSSWRSTGDVSLQGLTLSFGVDF